MLAFNRVLIAEEISGEIKLWYIGYFQEISSAKCDD